MLINLRLIVKQAILFKYIMLESVLGTNHYCAIQGQTTLSVFKSSTLFSVLPGNNHDLINEQHLST